MTNKELKHLNRTELLQMLLTLTEEIEQLKEQNAALAQALNDRRIQQDKVGSIAEAALQINQVFEHAEAAARQYLQNIQLLAQKQRVLYDETCAAAQKKADSIIAEANAYKIASIREADAYWNHVRGKVREMMQQEIPNGKYPAESKGKAES